MYSKVNFLTIKALIFEAIIDSMNVAFLLNRHKSKKIKTFAFRKSSMENLKTAKFQQKIGHYLCIYLQTTERTCSLLSMESY